MCLQTKSSRGVIGFRVLILLNLGTTTRVYVYMIEEHQARTNDQIVNVLLKLDESKASIYF